MKKLLLLIILFAVFLTSCGSSGYIDDILTADIMQRQYPELFPMSEEECGHPYFYYHTIDGINIDMSSDEYHYEFCIFPNCQHEHSVIRHSDAWTIARSGLSILFPDGYYYHPTIFNCADCGKQIYIFLRCRQGVSQCVEYNDYSHLATFTLEEWEQIALGNKELLSVKEMLEAN